MIKSYVSMLKHEFKGYNGKALSSDLMAGLTVTAVALPLALAFGVSCGASAAAGLITAILSGLIISALSGASFQISGPTGAMTAVLVSIIAKFDLDGVFVVCFLAGVLLVLAGIFKFGKLVNMIPRPVITGFTSGIAVIIALGQVDNFFGTTSTGTNAMEKLLSYGTLGFSPNWQAVLLGGVVIAIMLFWPKAWNARVPSSLVGIIVATIVCQFCGFEVARVGQIPRTLFLEQRLSFARVDWSRILEYVSPAVSIAALGMIESLLCGTSASRMKGEAFHPDQELLAQGIGNILIPLFGGVPATAAIARSSVAIKSGARTRLCGIFHAVGLLASMFLLGPVMALLPLSALSGVLLVTAWRMNEWGEIKYIFKNRFYGAIGKFLITMAATVLFDLTVAIIIGILFSALLFVMKSTRLEVNLSEIDNKKFRGEADVEQLHQNAVVVYLTGPVFFANANRLSELGAELSPDCTELIFSLRGVPAVDTTGVETLIDLCTAQQDAGRTVLLCGVNETVQKMLRRGGIHRHLGEHCFFWSVDRALLGIRDCPPAA